MNAFKIISEWVTLATLCSVLRCQECPTYNRLESQFILACHCKYVKNYCYGYIIIIIISCHRFSFFPGSSALEPVVNPTTQASSLSL
jgi:hypothetical protein